MDNFTFNINDLPTEVLLHLFSFFSQKELLLTVTPVCHLWHKLAIDPVLWQTLSFNLNEQNITAEVLQNCFARSHLLHSLEFIEVVHPSRYSLSVADIICCGSYCKKVVSLKLIGVSNLDLQMIAELVRNFPLLENLVVVGCKRLDHQCVLLICELSHFCTLNMPLDVHLDDKKVDVISCKLPKLENLDIGMWQVSDRYMFVFCLVSKYWNLVCTVEFLACGMLKSKTDY